MARNGKKGLTRAERLKAAKEWIATYSGKNLVRGHKKWFGVGDVRAVLELRMLGEDIPDARLEQARRDQKSRARANARRKQKRAQTNIFCESDDTFAFIVDYTEGGAPFGVTWEEMEAIEKGVETAPKPFRSRTGDNGRHVPRVNEIPVIDDDLPF